MLKLSSFVASLSKGCIHLHVMIQLHQVQLIALILYMLHLVTPF